MRLNRDLWSCIFLPKLYDFINRGAIVTLHFSNLGMIYFPCSVIILPQ